MRTKIIRRDQQGYRYTTLNEASKERVHKNVYSAINEVLNLYFFFARDPYYLSERMDSMNN